MELPQPKQQRTGKSKKEASMQHISQLEPINPTLGQKATKPRSKRSSKTDPLMGDQEVATLKRYRDKWPVTWQSIRDMRRSKPAAVDSMGAEALAIRYHHLTTDEQPSDIPTIPQTTPILRFHTLIATMLSPQTRDEQTSRAFDNLNQLVHPQHLTPLTLMNCDEQAIIQAIQPVSFPIVKAKNILEASRRCVEEFNHDIPSQLQDLLTFRGVGPKIAYLTFTIAWGKTLGICVDTHVHRISNRLGWVNTWHRKSNGPEYTRRSLEQFLPQDRWGECNELLVGFGQTICSAIRPSCAVCSVKDVCRYASDPSHMRDSLWKKSNSKISKADDPV